LVPGKRFTESGLYRFKEERSENTAHRKVVALEILYRIAFIEKKILMDHSPQNTTESRWNMKKT